MTYTLRWQGIGYGVAPDDDGDYYCNTCHNDPCSCNLPPYEQEYLRAWRNGAFDDDLVGYSEDIAMVGFERVVAS